ncbi:amidase family protein [Opitutales bacterium ASA1]|uniref:amidase n=1 Tax=Congregicoccus parvus TaxID=3081749 RepID=UPI002B2EB8F2|nr:amidase family protein [Opitutales bacterium ASA1]
MKSLRLLALAAATCALAVPVAPLRAATFDLSTATIAEIHAAMDAGALSSEKLVQLYLARIEAYDKKGPKINSVITMNPKALAEARALDVERLKSGRRSPLHGIPVVIKDLIDYAGLPTTAGFTPFGAPVPEKDAPHVARIKEAGGIVIAKVATVNWFGRDAFEKTHPIGATLNPYNTAFQPGGSSNGTGASLATWFATVGVGTDTGGSVMNPSSYCNLAGMIATQGLVSRTGIVPRGPTHDRAGPMGRSVYDIAVLLGAMAGFDPEDLDTYDGIGRFPRMEWADELAGSELKQFRIGVLREAMSTTPDNEAKTMFETTLAELRQAGAQIVDPVLGGIDIGRHIRDAMVSSYEVIQSGDVYLSRLGPKRPFKTMREMIEKVGPAVFTERYVDALKLPPMDENPEYLVRSRNRKAMIGLLEGLLEKHDLDAFLVLYRSTPPPADAPTGGGGSLGANLASPTGLPGVIVPGGFTKENLPFGLQLVGRNFDDLRLLQVAYAVEQATKKRRAPAITPALPGEVFSY